jgi:hypothetical protein
MMMMLVTLVAMQALTLAHCVAVQSDAAQSKQACLFAFF